MAKKKRKGFARVKFELNLLSSITRLNFHCTELKEKLDDYMTVVGCDMLAEQSKEEVLHTMAQMAGLYNNLLKAFDTTFEECLNEALKICEQAKKHDCSKCAGRNRAGICITIDCNR